MKNFLEIPAINLDGSRAQAHGTDAIAQIVSLSDLTPDRLVVGIVRLGTINGAPNDGLRDRQTSTDIRLDAKNPAHKAVIDAIASTLLAAYPTLANAAASPFPQEMADCQMQVDFITGTGGTASDALDWLEAYKLPAVARKAAKVKVADAALFQTRLDAAQATLGDAIQAKADADAALTAAQGADPVDAAVVKAAQDAVDAADKSVAAVQKTVDWRSALVAL